MLLAVLGEATDDTKRNVFIIVLDLKEVLKRLSTQISIELQTAFLQIQTEFWRADSEVLRNVASF